MIMQTYIRVQALVVGKATDRAAHLRDSWQRLFALFLLAGVAMLCAPGAAQAQATYTVNATTDTGAGSGTSGDILYCVTQANNNPGSTIEFSSSLNGHTITLSSTLTINANMTITGPGANLLTISGGGSVQVFSVNSGTVTISGLTIAQGNYQQGENGGGGGGIYNAGTLTVNNSTISGNTASSPSGGGGNYNTVTLTVTNSTISGNTETEGGGGGGGIFNDGTLTVTNSTISGNSATNGGGIFNYFGTLTVNNSTISGNTAASQGGGIANYYWGALTVNNSTIAGNSATQGGGIYNWGNVGVTNSIVAGNTSTNEPGDDCDGCGAQSIYNLISTSKSPITAAQLMLSPLGNYGGPTQTMVPLPGSPALNAGQYLAGEASTDQRGYPRPSTVDAPITLGAVQVAALIVTTGSDQTDANPDCTSGTGNTCSLRDALTLVNTGDTGDITFSPGLSSITLASALPAIAGYVNMIGPGANLLTVSGNLFVPVFSVNSGTNVTISGLTLYGGGGVDNAGTLTVNNSTFSRNFSHGDGGGIYNTGTLTVSNSTFSGNSADYGGGIDNDNGGTLTVNNSTFSSNTGVQAGGIFNNGTLTVNNSTISGNTSTANTLYAGGIFNHLGTLTMTNSIVAGNITKGNPGNDCAGCGTQNAHNLISIASSPITAAQLLLASLGSYGGPTQTMLPQPGSPAICTGAASLIPAGVTTDQRGFPRTNTSYTGYNAKSPCVDLGAVQTNYQSVEFANVPADVPYSALPGADASPAPIVSVTENGQNIGGVPVMLTFSGTGTAGGLGPVITTSGAGAVFNSLTVNAVGSDTLAATLDITNSVSISASAWLDIFSPQTVITLEAPGITYGETAWVLVTVSPQEGLGTVAGNVSLSVDGSTPTSLPLANGQAIFTLNNLTAGSHNLSASFAAQNGFYTSSNTGTLAVSPVPLTITAGSPSMTYGGTVPRVWARYAGFVGGDSAASLTTPPTCTAPGVTSTSAVGSYPTSCSGAVDGNYTINYVAGSLTVNQAPLTITASSASMTYGGAVPAIAASYVGFVNGDSSGSLSPKPACSTTATSSSPVGNYPSTCAGAGSTNYTISYTAGTVTVNPAPLTIIASSSLMVQGGTPPTITPSYSGFVNGDSASSLTPQPVCSTTASSSSPLGTYPSSCSGASDPNYTISYVPGTVTVSIPPATTTVISSHTPSPSVVGEAVTVNFQVSLVAKAAGTPTGTVTVSDGGGDTCSGAVAGTGGCVISFATAGTKTLTATYTSNTPWFAASTSKGVKQTVDKAGTLTTIIQSTPNPSVAGEAVTISFSVAPLAPGSGTPTGLVTVSAGAAGSCNASVAVGSCSITFLTGRTATLTAKYAGDSNFLSSTSAGVAQQASDFTISASPKSRSIAPGGATTYTVTLKPQDGFSGNVELTCAGAPTGATCEVPPNPLSLSGSGSASATVTLTTAQATPAGTYTLTLTGTYGSGNPSSGGLTNSTSVTLTVP